MSFGHLDGTTTKPSTAPTGIDITTLVEEWMSNESKPCHLLAQKLHDSTLTKLLHLATVVEMWKMITQEFSVKSSHVITAM